MGFKPQLDIGTCSCATADPTEHLIIQSSAACPIQSVSSASLFPFPGLSSVFAAQLLHNTHPSDSCPFTTPSFSLCHLSLTSRGFLSSAKLYICRMVFSPLFTFYSYTFLLTYFIDIIMHDVQITPWKLKLILQLKKSLDSRFKPKNTLVGIKKIHMEIQGS